MGKVDQNIFKRYEVKFMITREQKELLMKRLQDKIEHDEYAFGSVRSLYYDTDDFLLARRSLEKPVYKEKLRVRSYGKAADDSKVFVELKKKYKSIVYKRRITLNEQDACDYLSGEAKIAESQISKEIDYFMQFYGGLQPKVFLSYDREAFKGTEEEIRITFDENILRRDEDLNLCSENYGKFVMPQNMVLMEIKVPQTFPLWLVSFLSENHIYKTSFSKYGQAYVQMMTEQHKIAAPTVVSGASTQFYGIGDLKYA